MMPGTKEFITIHEVYISAAATQDFREIYDLHKLTICLADVYQCHDGKTAYVIHMDTHTENFRDQPSTNEHSKSYCAS